MNTQLPSEKTNVDKNNSKRIDRTYTFPIIPLDLSAKSNDGGDSVPISNQGYDVPQGTVYVNHETLIKNVIANDPLYDESQDENDDKEIIDDEKDALYTPGSKPKEGCNYCDKVFKRGCDLNRHVRSQKVKSCIDFVNTPRLYSDRATR